MTTMKTCSLLMVGAIAGCATPKSGILVMAHGGDDAWNRDVETVVGPLRDKYSVEIAFGMARTSTLREAVARLEHRGVRRIAVVRMFISGESFLRETEYILGLRQDAPPAPAGENHDHCMEKAEPIPVKSSLILSREGIADSPLVDDILLDRALALSTNPSQESVLILAHGPGDDGENERWLEKIRLRSRKTQNLGRFKEVRCETLREDWPEKREVAEKRIRAFVQSVTDGGGRVIVIPFRVAGFGPYREVLDGLRYVADGRGFCPHPNLTRWIEETARDSFDANRRNSGEADTETTLRGSRVSQKQ